MDNPDRDLARALGRLREQALELVRLIDECAPKPHPVEERVRKIMSLQLAPPITEILPNGLCANREDHAPHAVTSGSLAPFWCTADHMQREPGRSQRRQDDAAHLARVTNDGPCTCEDDLPLARLRAGGGLYYVGVKCGQRRDLSERSHG